MVKSCFILNYYTVNNMTRRNNIFHGDHVETQVKPLEGARKSVFSIVYKINF